MKNKDEDLGTLIGGILLMVAVVGVWAAGIYGYVWNIITLLGDMDTASATEAVVRILGIVVPPAGAIMGYF
jgi:uncharacterized membrane protein YqhA